MLVLEKQAYRKSTLLKNFLRSHHLFLSTAIPLFIAIGIALPVYFFYAFNIYAAVIVGIAAWAILHEYFYFYLIEDLYFRV